MVIFPKSVVVVAVVEVVVVVGAGLLLRLGALTLTSPAPVNHARPRLFSHPFNPIFILENSICL